MKKQSIFLFTLFIALLLFGSCKQDDESSSLELLNEQSYGGHTYAVSSKRLKWDDAKKFAEEAGGYLVILADMEENDFILQTYRTPLETHEDVLWIGLSDADVEGVFRWVNGEGLSFTNWAYGEPNNAYGTQDYGHMYADGTWDDVEVKECFAVVEFD